MVAVKVTPGWSAPVIRAVITAAGSSERGEGGGVEGRGDSQRS